MVLENLASLRGAEKHPVYLFFMAFVVTLVGMFISSQIFPSSSSVLTIAFVAIAFMPILNELLQKEETEEVEEKDVPFAFIATHFDVLHIYSWIFIGMIVAFSCAAVVFPETNDNCQGIECFLPEKSTLFTEQKKVYSGITGKVIGDKECFNGATKSFSSCFELIFFNNSWVMILAIIFSFIWGAGALFLLGWNASVIGLFIGLEITSNSLEAGILRAIGYLPHGAPEITAYFLAAMAGGIISATIVKQKFMEHEIRIVLVDTLLLLALATITLFLGALIETAAIFNYFELALGGMIAFFGLFFVLYTPNIRRGVNRIREIHSRP